MSARVEFLLDLGNDIVGKMTKYGLQIYVASEMTEYENGAIHTPATSVYVGRKGMEEIARAVATLKLSGELEAAPK